MKKLSVVFALLTALSLFVAGFSAYGLLFRRQPAASVSPAVVRPAVVTAPAITVSVDTLYEVLEPCTELVTATDRYTNRGTVSDHRELFGRTVSCTIEEVEFSYIGTLRAGIDLSEVKFEVNDASRVIYVTLPAPTVISHSIDTSSFIFQTKRNGLFTEISPDEFIAALDYISCEQEAVATKSGKVFRLASETAEQTVTGLLKAASVTADYTLRFYTAS